MGYVMRSRGRGSVAAAISGAGVGESELAGIPSGGQGARGRRALRRSG